MVKTVTTTVEKLAEKNDTIARLRAENEKLRNFVTPLASLRIPLSHYTALRDMLKEIRKNARSALEETP